ncbi:succinyl-diaminopimelate desuccinylase [Actinomarinicola tropica]|uniref:Succinyl-diaminopimelate desuccinylase n=1 Tax=Actinomarinicola tropica TaxID=2789776 RepID=A0A5Q2RV07_9ACTN|nr:succinyl-diaminopimelate desuccinylase [Actinomarinicola tropica]
MRLTAELIDLPSPSFEEQAFVEMLEGELRSVPWLDVERVGDNLVARTQLGRGVRVILAGHTDTVPANGNATARIDGDVLWGLGACDMKSGLAVMLELARTVDEPVVDVTYVFYAREEVAAAHNGLAELFELRPDLLVGDVALLGEPTSAAIEAGCQGTMRFVVTLVGQRAHTARAWKGVNAIHRVGRVLAALELYEPRQPVLDGCRFHEGLQAVAIEGGVAGNVVPDRATVTINHRFAPDRTIEEAEAHVREVLADLLVDGDTVEVVDAAPAAAPATGHPLVQRLIERHGLEVRAKLGWTDVARFSAAGIPAANFAPGDPSLAHAPDERVERRDLEVVAAALRDLLTVA